MKKKILKTMLLSTAALCMFVGAEAMGEVVFDVNPLAVQTVEATEGSVAQVQDIKEFEAALKDQSVTKINVLGNIKFTKNITNIPARDVTIDGNKQDGFVIDSNRYSIYGKQAKVQSANAGENNLFSIVNANITGDATVGRFFTGGSGNGPSSYGWDVLAQNVEYTGARFVHLSEGKLTFDKENIIKTRAENAWVHDLEFTNNSEYTGEAANKDHGQFSAFYFNGRLVDGKVTGKVTIGDKADVDLKISPQSDVNYYYPAFYDKVYQVNTGKDSKLSVDAAGVAFQFIPRADYQNIPSLNIGVSSKIYFNGRGGGKYQAVKLQEYGTQINMDKNSELYIDGNSERGVVESIYQYASFNLYNSKNLSIANHMPNQGLFRGDRTFVRGTGLKNVFTWNQTGGDYPQEEFTNKFPVNETFSTYVGLGGNSKDNNTTAEVFARDGFTRENFQINEYGKIQFTSGSKPIENGS